MRFHVLPFWFLFLISCAHSSADTDRVTRVVDGDTVILESIGRVRLIGVDTPETVHPQRPVEHFGREASKFTTEMLEGRQVRVEYDGPRQDEYGRTLAYLYLDDGTFFNAELIRRGYAHAYTRFPFKYLEQFRRYEREARQNNRGLWKQTPGREEANGVYRGNRNSRVYHSSECPHYECRNCTELLRSQEEAAAGGFRPHESCISPGDSR